MFSWAETLIPCLMDIFTEYWPSGVVGLADASRTFSAFIFNVFAVLLSHKDVLNEIHCQCNIL